MVLEHRGPEKMNNKKLFIFSAPYGNQFNVEYALELIRRQKNDC